MKIIRQRITHLFGKTVNLFLALCLLMSGLPVFVTTASAAAAATCSTNYTVQSGDTLSSIAATYSVTIADLAAANNLKDPYTIYIGQSLCIPGTSSSTSTTSSTTSATSSTGTGFTVERSGNYLVVTVSNYPKKGNYYVKIRGIRPTGSGWAKIGIFRTKKNTSVERTFKLPKKYYDKPIIEVCLKNAITNEVSCKLFFQ